MTLKQKIYNHYLQAIKDRVQQLQKILADLKESASNETKSTAGDKHETALAMLQIEQANTGGQLEVALSHQQAIEKINPSLHTSVAVNGSLIKTSRGYLFLSVAMGKAIVDGIPVMALSQQSPLGKQLTGLRSGNTATINGFVYTIEEVE
ncbi:MAG: hypothetical protein ABIX01_02415 [Chitinophagaceae bacterium]